MFCESVAGMKAWALFFDLLCALSILRNLENKGNRCLTALPKFGEAGLENALTFLEAKMDRYWKKGSRVVRADQETSQAPALGLGSQTACFCKCPRLGDVSGLSGR